MHRLLQQNVARLREHPMAELPRLQLPQRHAVSALHVVGPAERAALDQVSQLHESRMKHEVLVDAEDGMRGVRCLDQCLGGGGRIRQRLLHQHWLAGLKQRGGDARVLIGRHQHVGGVERVGRERVGDTGEGGRDRELARQRGRRWRPGIHDCRDGDAGQPVQRLGMRA